MELGFREQRGHGFLIGRELRRAVRSRSTAKDGCAAFRPRQEERILAQAQVTAWARVRAARCRGLAVKTAHHPAARAALPRPRS